MVNGQYEQPTQQTGVTKIRLIERVSVLMYVVDRLPVPQPVVSLCQDGDAGERWNNLDDRSVENIILVRIGDHCHGDDAVVRSTCTCPV